jgi:hypothetical protein
LSDAVVPTDLLKQHFRRARRPETTGELATIVAEYFVRHPVLGHRAMKAVHTARAVTLGTTVPITE